MTIFTPADEMHRLAKRAMDTGTAESREEAEAILRSYTIGLSIGAEASDRHHQAALLTAVALGRRVFLGGVWVEGALDVPLHCPLPLGATLRDAVISLGGAVGSPSTSAPVIAIGGPPRAKCGPFVVRTVFRGWRGGIVPGHAEDPITDNAETMPLAPMLAAALAVNEAFLHISGELAAAGRREAGLNLWNLGKGADWVSPDADEPTLRWLPSQLWLIGLGHLGQAYLWGLGLLPYADSGKLRLVLQDNDVITPSTESTSILSDASLVGEKKTRAMSDWAERRGFETQIIERLFDSNFKRHSGEPAIALCGMDNAVGRRALDQVGFDFVVEAGLGRGHNDFRSLLVHTLPGALSASELWQPDADAPETAADAAAYRKMLEQGSLDRCGVTLLAGKAVGAPFVGAVAGTLVLAELLRLLHGGRLHRVIEMNLIDLTYSRSTPQLRDFSALNPGFVQRG